MATSIADIFKTMRPFTWRDVSFPVTEMKITLGHRLAKHKYWGVDGARVEDNGVESLQFDAVIPFHNGIFPGKGERWTPTPLYPDGYRAFLSAFKLRGKAVLIHPELGPVMCKAETCTTTWSGNKQGGVEVHATWCETIDDAVIPEFSNTNGTSAARDLDAFLSSPAALARLAPTLPKYQPNFDDFVRQVGGAFDTVSILQQRVAGKIDHMAYQIDTITESLGRARTALSWPVDRAAKRMGEALLNLKNELARSGRTLVLFAVQDPVTLGMVSLITKAPVEELIRLNPSLARAPTVHSGAVVKYFAPRAS